MTTKIEYERRIKELNDEVRHHLHFRTQAEQLVKVVERERDEARFVIENMYNTIERLQHERDAAVSNLEAKDCAYRGAVLEGEKLTRERDEARELAREVGVAGMRLAGEMMEATDGWLVCLRDFGDLFLDCERAEKERDEARGRASNLEREVAKYKRMVMGRIEAINELNAECKRLRTLLEGSGDGR